MPHVEFCVTLKSASADVVSPFSAFAQATLEAAVRESLGGVALEGLSKTDGAGFLISAVAADVAALQEVRSSVLAGDFALGLTRALAASPRTDTAELTPGTTVRLDGLQQRPALNGKHGVLISFDTAAGRWAVDLGGSSQIRARPANLFPADIIATADATAFAEEHERQLLSLMTLTSHQQEKLAQCLVGDDVHLRAPAGAGKTFVALHRLLSHLLNGGEGQSLLYVARNKPLALFAVGWLVKRAPRDKLTALFDSLHVLYEPFAAGPQRVRLRGHTIVPVPIGSGGDGGDPHEYSLIVVDEAHHVYSHAESRSVVEGFVGNRSRRMLLSDVSQSLGCNVRYPSPMRDVALTEVIRCSRRIVAGAMAFQLGGDEKLLTKCHHESTGPPLKSFLFDLPSDGGEDDALDAYALQTVRAIEHVQSTFPGLRLHHRLAIIVPDARFRVGLRRALQCVIGTTLPEWKPRLVTAAEAAADLGDHLGDEQGMECAEAEAGQPKDVQDADQPAEDDDGDGDRPAGGDSVVMECVDQMDGLESLVVIAVGLDAAIGEGEAQSDKGHAAGERETRSTLYRAVTRAQLMVVVVNEYLPGGWLEFLGHVRLSTEEGFDADAELERTEVAAAEGVVRTQISDAITTHAVTTAARELPAAVVTALTADVATSREKGSPVEDAVSAAVSSWLRLQQHVERMLRELAAQLNASAKEATGREELPAVSTHAVRPAVRSVVAQRAGARGDAAGGESALERVAASIELGDAAADELASKVGLALHKGEAAQLDLAVQSELREWQHARLKVELKAALDGALSAEAGQTLAGPAPPPTLAPPIRDALTVTSTNALARVAASAAAIGAPSVTGGGGNVATLNATAAVGTVVDATPDVAVVAGTEVAGMRPRNELLAEAAALALRDWRAVEAEVREAINTVLQRREHAAFAGDASEDDRVALFNAAVGASAAGATLETAVPRAIAKLEEEHLERRLVVALAARTAAQHLNASDEVSAVLLSACKRRVVTVSGTADVDVCALETVAQWLHDAGRASRAIEQTAVRLQLALSPADLAQLLPAVVRVVWEPPPPPNDETADQEAADDANGGPGAGGGAGNQDAPPPPPPPPSPPSTPSPDAIARAAEEVVWAWAERSQSALELEAQVASAFDAEVTAQRLMLPDAAATKLKAGVAAAVRRGEPLEESVRNALAEWHRQLLRRQVQQSVWDPSGNQSRRMTGMARFMPFKQAGTESLDHEMLTMIFATLPFTALGKLSLVCKRWRSAASDPSWKPELVAYAWGHGNFNGLGTRAAKPTLLPFSLSKQVWKLVCADAATLALTLDGDVYHWGQYWLHERRGGDPPTVEPTKLNALSDVIAIACSPSGYFHGRMQRDGFSCAAVTASGALYTWGLNRCHQLLHNSQVVARPTRTERFDGSWRSERAVAVAVGLDYLAVQVMAAPPVGASSGRGAGTGSGAGTRESRVFSCGRFNTPRDEHALMEWEELRGVPIRQLAGGAFHCCAVSTRGELYTWGDQAGRDQSNGNLLGHGLVEALEDATNPMCVRPRRVAEPGLGPVAEVACSTYVTVAITVDGRVFTWGDSDGNALGHSRITCHQPQWISALRGQHMSHASVSYTNGAVASDQGRCYVWGGNCWEGGIAAGRNSTGPTEVAWGGVPSCYRCSSVALAFQHGYLIFRKQP